MDTVSMMSLDIAYLGQPYCNLNLSGSSNSVYLGQPFYGYPLGSKISINSLSGAATKSIGVFESAKVSKVIGVAIG